MDRCLTDTALNVRLRALVAGARIITPHRFGPYIWYDRVVTVGGGPCGSRVPKGRSELRPRVDPLREGTKGGKREMGERAEAGGEAVSPAAAPRAVCIDPLPGAPQAHTPGPARPGPRYPNNTSEAAPEAGRGPQRGDTARRGGEREREIGGRNPRAPWTREPTGGIRRAVPGPPPPAAARFRGTAALRAADPSPHTGVCR